ncbi:MAG: hypothetical protein M1469_08865 [Bacteroidetes bacterium]|nr:hypothetical protein [Bacteroidota bacterium]
MITLIIFAFLAGLVTILAPCIWPILPIILSSSVAGKGRKRPLGITLGVMLGFGFFTLAISYLVKIFHFNPDALRVVAVFVIGILGLTMVIPALSRIIEGSISWPSSLFGQRSKQGSGFGAGFLTGLSLGIVWSPCAGPILAAIVTLAATGKVTFAVIMITAAYVAGVGIPLFIFAYGGQRVITRTRFLSAHLGKIQQGFGLVMLLTAVAIYTNMEYFYPTGTLATGQREFVLASKPAVSSFSLGGQWVIRQHEAVAGKNATLEYHFYADKVFLVLRPGSAGIGAKVKVLLDGKPVNSADAGSDVKDGVIMIDSARLYSLINLKGRKESHVLRLQFETPGVEAFAFTFG